MAAWYWLNSRTNQNVPSRSMSAGPNNAESK
jgi:hypothetical protein